VHAAVALSSQVKFADTSQLPLQLAVHWVEHDADGDCPEQLTLH
jgi:hypothetical protein